jgi:hypothetical protein
VTAARDVGPEGSVGEARVNTHATPPIATIPNGHNTIKSPDISASLS